MSTNFKMNGFVRKLFVIVAFILAGAEHLCAFSLLGPHPPWQTTRIDYEPAAPGDRPIGGPMNINEEYRWNVPILYYGYSPEFLSYFGQKGVEAIEEAIAIMKDLPSMETVNLDDYQMESARVNLRARELGLTDIKSAALSLILQIRGLTDPTRYVFTLRNRYVVGNIPYYHVIKRNFDPVTLRPSSYVNGTLWTYNGFIETPTWTAVASFPVDPLERLLPRTLPVVSYIYANTGLSSFVPDGFYWTQLTRDDIGGLKHIYRSSNFNPENSIPGVTDGSGAVVDPNAGQQPIGIFPGGTDFTDFPGVIIDPGESPTDFPVISTNTLPVGPPAPDPVGVASPAAIRGGIDYIGMERSDYDALLGVYFEPRTYRYNETILTNNRIAFRSLTRTVTQPDIIFDASDLQGGVATQGWLIWTETAADGWLNSDAMDGITGDDYGPGVITPPFRIRFNTAGDVYYNSPIFGVSEEEAIRFLTWGSFDGSTNDPVVFPVGTSILDLERRVGQ